MASLTSKRFDEQYLPETTLFFRLNCMSPSLCSIAIDPTKAIYGKPFLCELRALKIISNSLSLRCTFDRYWKSFLAMRDLLLYIIFILFIVSVICVHMYMGVLKQHCVKKPLSPMSASAWNEFTLNRGELFCQYSIFSSIHFIGMKMLSLRLFFSWIESNCLPAFNRKIERQRYLFSENMRKILHNFTGKIVLKV